MGCTCKDVLCFCFLYIFSIQKAMAPHSSTFAWKISWTEKSGRLQSMGSQSQTRLSNFTFTRMEEAVLISSGKAVTNYPAVFWVTAHWGWSFGIAKPVFCDSSTLQQRKAVSESLFQVPNRQDVIGPAWARLASLLPLAMAREWCHRDKNDCWWCTTGD